MRLSTVSALFFATVASVYAADVSDVLDLTASNFEGQVNPQDLILVEFFAPWCGHCKALAPHYEEAATSLKPKGIPIAKVDCVEQSELCKTHGVSGYPTLKVFKKGQPSDYGGPRTAEGIVTYMVKQSLPPVSTVTKTDHSEFIKADKIVVVLYADAASTGFSKYAEAHREEFLFGHAADPALAEAAGVSQPAVVVYRAFDEPKIVYSGSATSIDEARFGKWLKSNAVPLLDQVNGENYSDYADTGLPLAYLFVDPNAARHEALVESFKPLAKEYQGKVNFAWIDAVKFAEHGKSLSLAAQWPAFVIQDIQKQSKFPFDQSKEFSPESIASFVKDVVDGKIEPSLKSEPIPEKQDEPVFVLVTKQFEQVVFDDSKDVLVEFYAPWCGHCKRLAPIYEELGAKFAGVKDKVTIAKMDATENDVPPSAPFRVAGFPTIKFKAAGTRDFIDYNGDRTLEAFTEFIEKHAKNKFDLSVVASSPAASSPAVTPAEKHARPYRALRASRWFRRILSDYCVHI